MLVVVKLAAAASRHQVGGQSPLDEPRGRRQTLTRDIGIEMMGGVLHDVGQEPSDRAREDDVDGPLNLSFEEPPLGPAFEEAGGRVRVVIENDETHHPIPDQKRKNDAQQDGAASEDELEGQESEYEREIVCMQGPARAERTEALGRQIFPPDLQQVIEAESGGGPVEALN
jgi:hypothetical protein